MKSTQLLTTTGILGLLLLAISNVASAQKLDKPIALPEASMDKGLLENLVSPHARIKHWPNSWIPKVCKKEVEDEKLNPRDMEVFEIWYDDVSNISRVLSIDANWEVS